MYEYQSPFQHEMNSRRITSSWNNHRDLEYFDEEGRRGGGIETNKLRGISIPRNSSITVVPCSRPRRQAETLVGKCIELEDENEESGEEDTDNKDGLSFRQKRLLLARKRMDASVTYSKGVTLGIGGYTTNEYSKRSNNERSASVSRVYDGMLDVEGSTQNTYIHPITSRNNIRPSSVSRVPPDRTTNSFQSSSGIQTTPPSSVSQNRTRTNGPSRRISSRVLAETTSQTDFVEVALDSMSLKTSPSLNKSPIRDTQSLSPAHDDVSSLGSTGSEAYSSRHWLPPKLLKTQQPSSIPPAGSATEMTITKAKNTPKSSKYHQHRHQRTNESGNVSSPDSFSNDVHPPRYVSATTQSKHEEQRSKRFSSSSSSSSFSHQDTPVSRETVQNDDIYALQIHEKINPTLTKNNQENTEQESTLRINASVGNGGSSGTITKGTSDFLSFERAQKAKAMRRSRLAHSNTLSNTDASEKELSDKNLIKKHIYAASDTTKGNNLITSNSTTATMTTSSTSIGSVPSSIIKSNTLSKRPETVLMTTIPRIETPSSPASEGNYLDLEDDRSIKSSVTTCTYLSCASENAKVSSGNSTNLQHSRSNRLRRRKIALIYHVLTCTHPPPQVKPSSTNGVFTSEEYIPCPKLKCCYALTVLIRHAQTCTFVSKDGVEQCDIPSCADYKKAWLHFRRCALARSTGKRKFCLLCSDVSLPTTTGDDSNQIHTNITS